MSTPPWHKPGKTPRTEKVSKYLLTPSLARAPTGKVRNPLWHPAKQKFRKRPDESNMIADTLYRKQIRHQPPKSWQVLYNTLPSKECPSRRLGNPLLHSVTQKVGKRPGKSRDQEQRKHRSDKSTTSSGCLQWLHVCQGEDWNITKFVTYNY